ncbi:helix-turn-helix domain-containing protein [Stackebrandtia soli]|uniref:helix-turn-helix domain-containing protein n=1 Tax=Stackebrandtia soli TaxID=1892856 RepID=UPI0039ECCEE6
MAKQAKQLPMMMLGMALRQLREEAGLSTRQVIAKAQGSLSVAKLSAIENAKRPVSAFDVAGLCGIYKATPEHTTHLRRMAEEALNPGWWEDYSTYMLREFSMCLELESVAARIDIYESELVPGLLQVESYVRAQNAVAPSLTSDEVNQRVKLQTLRQERFWGRSPAPTVRIAMHESVITRRMSGPKEDAEQREHIAKMARLDNLTVRVVPNRGLHPSMLGAYMILTSGIPAISDAVYTEFITGARYDTTESSLTACRRFFDATWQMAVPVEEYLNDTR